MNTVFSDNLKKFRQQKNLTQEQAAEILGVSPHTVSRWECNTTLPDVTMLPKIAKLYCVTIDDFFRETSVAYENYAQRKNKEISTKTGTAKRRIDHSDSTRLFMSARRPMDQPSL